MLERRSLLRGSPPWLVASAVLLVLAWPGGALARTDADAATAAFERGAFETAVEHWSRAARTAQQAGDADARVVALLRASEALVALGRYRQAAHVLDDALKVAEQTKQTARVRLLLARRGNILVAIGPGAAAETLLRRALAMARDAGDDALAAAVLNDLGNALMTLRKLDEAAAAYREAGGIADRTGDAVLATRARVNLSAALRRGGNATAARAALDEALDRIQRVGPSHDVAFTLVSIGVGYREVRGGVTPDPTGALLLQSARALNEAAALADRLGDRRTASFARGYLGTLYEDEGRYDEALRLTRQALFDAQTVNAPESLYRWQWQAGRIHRKRGKLDEAIVAYRGAADSVAAMRPELSVRYDVPAESFRASVGLLFFEFVDLLLRQASVVQGQPGSTAAAAPDAARALLVEARDVVESLKVAELRDYFRDDCVDIALSRVTQLDAVSPTAAVVYPIVLPDRTELLVTLPTGLRRFVVPVGEAQLTREVRQFRQMLERRTTRQYLRHSRQIYDWLIRPLEAELAAAKLESLIFVPDAALRTIPMGALHDGREFLVAKYALAITPGLKLSDPKPLDRRRLRMLALGVTEAVQGFAPLPEVGGELAAVREVFGGTTLINAEFSVANVERELRTGAYTIVHVASHGEFGGNVETTFLLAYDGKLSMDRLDQLIGTFKYREEPLELLTLSACDTAEGDDRAALGLAGVAVKAGARSAVATLWSVNDEASAGLIADFYRELKQPGVSRAVALQRAQVKLLTDPRYQHPGFWSPFLLINNWL